jgi:hypothetical protein
MPHVFNQSEHPFGQCGHFIQVEHFEKPWFLIVCAIIKQHVLKNNREMKEANGSKSMGSA